MIDSDVSALASEIFYTNVELYGVDPTDRNAQDAALRQAHGQHADLLAFARQWDAAAADERAVVLSAASSEEQLRRYPRATAYERYLIDCEND